MEPHLGVGVGDELPARRRHEAAALEVGPEPVTQRDTPVGPVDPVMSDGSGVAGAGPDAGVEAMAVRELVEGSADEGAAVLDRLRPIHPRKPAPQVVSIRVHGVEQRLRLVQLEEPEPGALQDRAFEHDTPLLPGHSGPRRIARPQVGLDGTVARWVRPVPCGGSLLRGASLDGAPVPS